MEKKKEKERKNLRNKERYFFFLFFSSDYNRKNGKRDVTGNLNFNGKRKKHVIQ